MSAAPPTGAAPAPAPPTAVAAPAAAAAAPTKSTVWILATDAGEGVVSVVSSAAKAAEARRKDQETKLFGAFVYTPGPENNVVYVACGEIDGAVIVKVAAAGTEDAAKALCIKGDKVDNAHDIYWSYCKKSVI